MVTLVPNTKEYKNVKNYRPIACYITFYKLISKILTNRLGKTLQSVIHLSQAAFVPGQVIHNHVLLAYELLKGYNRKGGTHRVMIQLDLQKAYNMVEWYELEIILREIGLPGRFTHWIMIVVKTVTYNFNINGELTTKIQARRGVRKGDPIPPLLFVMMMEYLNILLIKMQKD